MKTQPEVFVMIVMSVILHVGYGFTEEEKQNAVKLLESMAQTRKGLGALREVVDGIDGDLLKTQKRWAPGCNVGAGMPGYQCHLAALRSDLESGNWLSNSQLSPGKRSGVTMNGSIKPSEILWKVRELQTKRQGLDLLKRILSEMDSDLMQEQKRTCAVNLGGHCSTESAASMSNQWHYLNSPLSPGRKRRDTGLFKKLISGELLNAASKIENTTKDQVES